MLPSLFVSYHVKRAHPWSYHDAVGVGLPLDHRHFPGLPFTLPTKSLPEGREEQVSLRVEDGVWGERASGLDSFTRSHRLVFGLSLPM